MPTASVAFATPASASARKRWLLYSPLARFLIFVALFVAGSALTGIVLHLLFGMDKAALAGKGAATLESGLAQLVLRAVPALLTDLGIDGYVTIGIFGVALFQALATAPSGIAGQISALIARLSAGLSRGRTR